MAAAASSVRLRLQQAALTLFDEHGYDRTTAADIAARAGVTERTFFRHFADKREVLFDGEAILRAALTAAIDRTPPSRGPLTTLFDAFRSVAPLLENNRPFAVPRAAIIAATPALREREGAKLAALADALAHDLQVRDVPVARATLAARAAMAAFEQATLAWLDDPAVGLIPRLDRAERDLRSLL